MMQKPKAEPQAKERLAPNGLYGYSVVERLGKPITIVNNANGAIAAEIYGHNTVDITEGALPLANLIAAAPELLVALKDAADRLDKAKEIADKNGEISNASWYASYAEEARAAIAKAEGRL